MVARQVPNRTALIVLGMHRSGTSAVAGVLATMGAAAPRDPLAAHAMNPGGFFESAGLTDLDDALMGELGTSWFDWGPMPDAWTTSAAAEQYRGLLAEKLVESFGDEELFVLKDPRMCRLAPLWLDLLRASGCRPVIVSVHRPPQDVAASLEHWWAAGFDPSYGRLLWLRYVLDGERATRHQTRVFCSYRQLVEDWASVVGRVADGADLQWPRQVGDVAAEVSTFLGKRAEMPRVERPDPPVLTPWERTVFDILEAWAATGEDPADHATLDEIWAGLETASPNFAPVVQAGRAADVRRQELDATVAEFEKMVAGLRSEVQTADQSLRHQGSLVEQQAAEIARLNEHAARLDEEAARLGRECLLLERQASAEMRTRIVDGFGELRQVRQLLAKREKEIVAVSLERDELLESHSWRVTRPVRAVSGLARRTLPGSRADEEPQS